MPPGAKPGREARMHPSEPVLDVSHLGHVELRTPRPEESLRFFVDVMGMTESGRQGDSIYLRGWDDYERYSLQLTASRSAGLGHAGFRTRSPQALERRVAALRAAGHAVTRMRGSSATAPAGASRIRMGISSSSITRRSGTRRRPSCARP
jgi:catechol 2,3-dioxygenase-like lactoylglutathione lyase family enzyme